MSTLQQQIKQFEEKVRVCMKNHDWTKAISMFTRISTIDPSVSSVRDLRGFVEDHEEYLDTKSVCVYAQWYADNVSYLSELKSTFKLRIYNPLLLGLDRVSSSVDLNVASENSLMSQEKQVASHLAQLYEIVGMALNDDEPVDASLLSATKNLPGMDKMSESLRDLVQLTPDVLGKFKEMGSLASQWLSTETELRSQIQIREMKLEREKTILIGKLTTISGVIENQEKELQQSTQDLQDLLDREERTDIIKGENHSLEVKINSMEEKLHKVQLQIDDIEDLLQTTTDNPKFREKLQQDLKDRQQQHKQHKQKLDLLYYQRDIILEDLIVELEVRPSLIRSTNTAQDRCMTLESAIESNRAEKSRLENQLRPYSGNENTKPSSGDENTNPNINDKSEVTHSA